MFVAGRQLPLLLTTARGPLGPAAESDPKLFNRKSCCKPRIGIVPRTRIGILLGARIGILSGTRIGSLVETRIGILMGTRIGTLTGTRIGILTGPRIGILTGTRIGIITGTRIGIIIGTVGGTPIINPFRSHNSARTWNPSWTRSRSRNHSSESKRR